MVQINFATSEVQCKIVYYGPARAGKTANLRAIHARTPDRMRGALTTITTDTDRTLFFDFLPVDLGRIAGIRTKIHLYAVPYLERRNAVRTLVLEGADGIVFVADATPDRLAENVESLKNLEENLATFQRKLEEIPLVFQWNKTDTAGAADHSALATRLNPNGLPAFAASASTGAGVFTTLKAITQLVLHNASKVPALREVARTAAAMDAQEEPEEVPSIAAAKATPSLERTPEPVAAAEGGEPSLIHTPRWRQTPETSTSTGTNTRTGWPAEPKTEDFPALPAQPEPETETPFRLPPAPLSRPEPATATGGRAQEPAADPVPQTASGSRVVPIADKTADGESVRQVTVRPPQQPRKPVEPAGARRRHSDWGGDAARGGRWGATQPARPLKSRDARPVVDRRRARRPAHAAHATAASLTAGGLAAALFLATIGYLVHTLL